MILSKLSRMVRHGSFPMKVVSLLRNNLVRTNHTLLYFCPKRLHSLMDSGTAFPLGLYPVVSCFEFAYISVFDFVISFL